MILGIDIGTTNSKAGIFSEEGKMIAVVSRPTVAHRHQEGFSYYEPEEMWTFVADALRQVMSEAGFPRISSIGITSMAESGLLVDRMSGKPRSIFMPWFDPCSTPQAERMKREADMYERFVASGLHGGFKHGLPKMMWLLERDPSSFSNAVWLSASGYIAYRLTGAFGFDDSLAARTFVYRMDKRAWDFDFARHFGLPDHIFPEILPSGTPLGRVTPEHAALGLESGIPVAISGHDHVCAALSVGAIHPGRVYDSMGTAETLVGTIPVQPLGRKEFETGLSFGCHVAPGRMFWMGGNASSGGSVEWWRSQSGDVPVSYEEMIRWLDELPVDPSGILYYPYLSGSGAPTPDSKAKAAFIGLTKQHDRKHMAKSVLEGTAYQLEAIRRVAEGIGGHPIRKLLVVGGGTRNPHWLRIKADISGCELIVPPIEEASLLGAALAAGAGSGVYDSVDAAAEAVSLENASSIVPDSARHDAYRQLYERGYTVLQQALRSCYAEL